MIVENSDLPPTSSRAAWPRFAAIPPVQNRFESRDTAIDRAALDIEITTAGSTPVRWPRVFPGL